MNAFFNFSGTHKRKSRSGERLEEVFRLHGEQSSPAVKKAEYEIFLLYGLK